MKKKHIKKNHKMKKNRKMKKKSRNENKLQNEEKSNDWLEDAIKAGGINYYNYNEFGDEEKIGKGAFGTVSKSEWKIGGVVVALKCLSNYTEGKTPEVFIKEVKFLQSLSFHPRVNHFYGVTKDSKGIYKMVLQFANGGNLREYLTKNFSSLQWEDKFRIAKEIAQALIFLHSKNIIHRDLNPKNILVHDDKIMISDFGLAKSMTYVTSEASVSTSIDFGMPAFMDAECYTKNSKYIYTTKTDIYSFGVVLWEISSGHKPFPSLKRIQIAIKIYNGEREEPIEGTPPEYVELYKRCWDGDPNKRPSIEEVHKSLDKLMHNKPTDSHENMGKSLGEMFEQVISRGIVHSHEYGQFGNHIKISDEGYGLIYKSEWRNSIVALKCFTINEKTLDKTVVENFVGKLKILQEANHPNIIKFHGLTRDPSSEYYNMIFQFAEDGNLRNYLAKKFSKLKWNEKLRMAIEIGYGLQYLHENGITHSALHSNNVLVCQGKMLIAGFGIFELTDESLSITVDRKMSAYIEPQCLADPTYQRDIKSDIYSLSIIFWEISSGRPPFNSLENRYAIAIHISKGGRETPAENTPPQYVQLYKQCWDDDPKKRPDIESVLETLRQLSSQNKV